MLSAPPCRLVGRRVLIEGRIAAARVTIADGRVLRVEEGPSAPAAGDLDLGDLLLAPGLVDLHGDAFERQLMPRPGVMIDLDVALADTDRQLSAGGITTAFHGLTWSWEPGLRSTETGRRVIHAIERAAPHLLVEHRLHIRFEIGNHDGSAELEALIAAGRAHLVALNDHTPDMAAAATKATGNIGAAYRALTPLADFNALALSVAARAREVPTTVARIAAACARAGLPMLSHDDPDAAARRASRALGCGICEFPKTREAAAEARAKGEPVVMGAPNVLRGRSHMGWMGAAEAVGAGLCTVLASDYHYPSLLAAPYRLAALGHCSLEAGWDLVSRNPARAAGLDDRGRIAEGTRADLVAVQDREGFEPRVVATWKAGRLVSRMGELASPREPTRTADGFR